MMIRKHLRVALLLTLVGALLERATPAAAEPVASPAVSETAPLDAQSFEVTMKLQGEEPWKDTLVFAAGTFTSEACASYGFGPSGRTPALYRFRGTLR